MIESMFDRYVIARWAYLIGESIISDQEYDRLEKEFKATYPDNEYANRQWSFDKCPKELLTKYNMTSMIKDTTVGYMAESIESVNDEDSYNNRFASINEPTRVSYKIDGWNTRVSYFNGNLVEVASRGRSGNNLDMSNISTMFPKTIPIMGRVAITGELSIPNRLWDEYKTITGNTDQRASVRTALARGDIKYLSFMSFNIYSENTKITGDVYAKLNELGFETPKFKIVNNKKELDQALKYLSYINRVYTHLTDGLVIENSKYQLAIRLGAWKEYSSHSFVIGYEEDQGMYGRFMKVLCNPVTIGGKTFRKVSINNIASIVENDLRIGSPIAFSLRSSANVVIDVWETKKLQRSWNNKYDEYKIKILKNQSVL